MSDQFPKNFCSIPWHSIYIHPNGSVRPCCMQSVYYGDTAEGDNVEKVWNKTKAQELRQSFLDGKIPSTCSSCTLKEQSSGKSRRLAFNAYMEKTFPEKVASPRSPIAPMDIVFLDLSLSNRCNLKCRFCGPQNSTSWFEDAQKLKAHDGHFWNQYMGEEHGLVSQKSQDYVDLVNRSPLLRRIEIKGGEPFLSHEQIPFLQELIKQKKSQDIELEYSTNGTVVLPALKEIWPHFKSVYVSLSVEATGGAYQYLRGGMHTLEKIEENINFYKYFSNLTLALHITYSGYNLFSLPSLIDWYEKNRLVNKNLKLWKIGLVANPRPLYVGSLPEEIRNTALKQIESFSGDQWNAVRNSLQQSVGREQSLQHFQQFKKYVSDLDTIRQTSFLDVCPEYKNFWDL